MVTRYQKLLDAAPLAIESDLAVLTNLLKKSAQVDPSDPKSIQEVADLAYAANKSALAVSAWTKDTCAVIFLWESISIHLEWLLRQQLPHQQLF